jgi:hypothetical protein
VASLSPLLAMATASVLAAWAAVLIGQARGADALAGPVFSGMIGPLAAVGVSWWLVRRAHGRDPAGLMRVMVAAFAGKVVFFAAYVVAMIRVFGVEPRAFGLSFMSFLIGLYTVQAVLLSRQLRVSLQEER